MSILNMKVLVINTTSIPGADLMSQTSVLVSALKKCLRAKGATYRDVAEALDLSEASVKRIFSEETFSLRRLEEVCRYLDMSLFDMARIADSQRKSESVALTMEQEQALASQPELLSFFYLLLVGWSPARITRRLKLSDRQLTRSLIHLDRLKLIELNPNNRVRLLTPNWISWSADGPIRARYERQVKNQFFDHKFDSADERMTLETAELSDASIKVLQRRLDKLVAEFHELAEIDRSLAAQHKRSFGLMLGYRPWTFWEVVMPTANANQ